MAEIVRSALLPYRAEQVYTLVNDIAAYPEFMEGCSGAQVLHQTESMMEARLDLSRAGLSYSLTTRNTLQPPTTVTMLLVDGPFSEFNGQWQVQPLSDMACKVSVELRFKLESRVLDKAVRVLFNPMADNLVDAVVKRAHHLFGNKP